jgi:hypothetical protein
MFIDRTWFFVPKLRRVFGCFRPKGIAASRDSLGEFVRRPLPELGILHVANGDIGPNCRDLGRQTYGAMVLVREVS